MRLQRWWLAVPLLVLGSAIGWYLASPLFINRAVSEALPTGSVASAAPTQAMETAMAETPQDMDESMPETGQPILARAGAFYPVAHEGQGSARIYRLGDGTSILRFEGFEVLNGPDLHVGLVPVDPVPNTVGIEIPGYVDLGELKGNRGDQNYELAEDLTLEGTWSVVIWCAPFRVPFAAAVLEVVE